MIKKWNYERVKISGMSGGEKWRGVKEGET
jgi:hypothetical protein